MAAALNYGYVDFRHHRCVLNQSDNILTKFGDDWSNRNEMATVFQNSRWRRPPSWIFQICISDFIDLFQIEVPMFSLVFATIGQIVQKEQQFFEIQYGGDRHLEFSQICISDVIDMFQFEVPMFQLMLMTIGQILKKWQLFSKSKMAAAAILKSTIPVEPSSREMNA